MQETLGQRDHRSTLNLRFTGCQSSGIILPPHTVHHAVQNAVQVQAGKVLPGYSSHHLSPEVRQQALGRRKGDGINLIDALLPVLNLNTHL